jgi:hypothetical protein
MVELRAVGLCGIEIRRDGNDSGIVHRLGCWRVPAQVSPNTLGSRIFGHHTEAAEIASEWKNGEL